MRWCLSLIHISDSLSPVLNCGAQGVDLFFILSGFVLTWNYLDRIDVYKRQM